MNAKEMNLKIKIQEDAIDNLRKDYSNTFKFQSLKCFNCSKGLSENHNFKDQLDFQQMIYNSQHSFIQKVLSGQYSSYFFDSKIDERLKSIVLADGTFLKFSKEHGLYLESQSQNNNKNDKRHIIHKLEDSESKWSFSRLNESSFAQKVSTSSNMDENHSSSNDIIDLNFLLPFLSDGNTMEKFNMSLMDSTETTNSDCQLTDKTTFSGVLSNDEMCLPIEVITGELHKNIDSSNFKGTKVKNNDNVGPPHQVDMDINTYITATDIVDELSPINIDGCKFKKDYKIKDEMEKISCVYNIDNERDNISIFNDQRMITKSISEVTESNVSVQSKKRVKKRKSCTEYRETKSLVNMEDDKISVIQEKIVDKCSKNEVSVSINCLKHESRESDNILNNSEIYNVKYPTKTTLSNETKLCGKMKLPIATSKHSIETICCSKIKMQDTTNLIKETLPKKRGKKKESFVESQTFDIETNKINLLTEKGLEACCENHSSNNIFDPITSRAASNRRKCLLSSNAQSMETIQCPDNVIIDATDSNVDALTKKRARKRKSSVEFQNINTGKNDSYSLTEKDIEAYCKNKDSSNIPDSITTRAASDKRKHLLSSNGESMKLNLCTSHKVVEATHSNVDALPKKRGRKIKRFVKSKNINMKNNKSSLLAKKDSRACCESEVSINVLNSIATRAATNRRKSLLFSNGKSMQTHIYTKHKIVDVTNLNVDALSKKRGRKKRPFGLSKNINNKNNKSCLLTKMDSDAYCESEDSNNILDSITTRAVSDKRKRLLSSNGHNSIFKKVEETTYLNGDALPKKRGRKRKSFLESQNVNIKENESFVVTRKGSMASNENQNSLNNLVPITTRATTEKRRILLSSSERIIETSCIIDNKLGEVANSTGNTRIKKYVKKGQLKSIDEMNSVTNENRESLTYDNRERTLDEIITDVLDSLAMDVKKLPRIKKKRKLLDCYNRERTVDEIITDVLNSIAINVRNIPKLNKTRMSLKSYNKRKNARKCRYNQNVLEVTNLVSKVISRPDCDMIDEMTYINVEEDERCFRGTAITEQSCQRRDYCTNLNDIVDINDKFTESQEKFPRSDSMTVNEVNRAIVLDLFNKSSDIDIKEIKSTDDYFLEINVLSAADEYKMKTHSVKDDIVFSSGFLDRNLCCSKSSEEIMSNCECSEVDKNTFQNACNDVIGVIQATESETTIENLVLVNIEGSKYTKKETDVNLSIIENGSLIADDDIQTCNGFEVPDILNDGDEMNSILAFNESEEKAHIMNNDYTGPMTIFIEKNDNESNVLSKNIVIEHNVFQKNNVEYEKNDTIYHNDHTGSFPVDMDIVTLDKSESNIIMDGAYDVYSRIVNDENIKRSSFITNNNLTSDLSDLNAAKSSSVICDQGLLSVANQNMPMEVTTDLNIVEPQRTISTKWIICDSNNTRMPQSLQSKLEDQDVVIDLTKESHEDVLLDLLIQCQGMETFKLNSFISSHLNLNSHEDAQNYLSKILEYVSENVHRSPIRLCIAKIIHFLLLRILYQFPKVLVYYYRHLMETLRNDDVSIVALLVDVNVGVFVSLKQTKILMTFIVDLMRHPSVPMLLVVRNIDPTVVFTEAIMEEYGPMVGLIKAIILYEYSITKNSNLKKIIEDMAFEVQKFWLNGETITSVTKMESINSFMLTVRQICDNCSGERFLAIVNNLDDLRKKYVESVF